VGHQLHGLEPRPSALSYYKQRPTDSEFLPLHLQSSRVGYRDWLGAVIEAADGVPPSVSVLPRAGKEIEQQAIYHRARLLVAGYAMDNMKPLDFAEACAALIITTDAETHDLINTLAGSWIKSADLVATQLVSAVRRALYGSNGSAPRDSTVLDGTKYRFWANTEDAFYKRLREAADILEAKARELSEHRDELLRIAGATWLGVLRHCAVRIFDDAVPIDSADSDRISDVVEGRKLLALALAGHGPVGKQLLEQLSQPAIRKTTTKRGRQAA
jgi:CRISPR system Cascade subunit CasA